MSTIAEREDPVKEPQRHGNTAFDASSSSLLAATKSSDDGDNTSGCNGIGKRGVTSEGYVGATDSAVVVGNTNGDGSTYIL
ncbi:hypothetical protein F441_13846 [Phytophthora nicotianae CJ01A1]|uniref:Uncharacterized protein n=1 Tax=Phytophthora nicotianae CJ01A1 TaxID=1317063 RepID=W2WJG8_PHYNI|nr:hypothetical protein F441_13846 [Phytophthora nicotianae CJ01A1]